MKVINVFPRNAELGLDVCPAQVMLIDGRIRGRENDDEIIVYETVGVGSQDLVAAKLIYEKAKAAGVGMKWGE